MSEQNTEFVNLSGELIPENTRVTQADPRLTVAYTNGGYIFSKLPRLYLAKEKVTQFIVDEDALRQVETRRSPGDEFRTFEPRMTSRDVQTQFHGIGVRATQHDINEADPALPNVLDVKMVLARGIVADGFETRLVTKVTTDANYPTGHVFGAGTPWSNASGDPATNVASAKQRILLSSGGGTLRGGRWVGMCSRPTFDAAIAGSPDIQARWTSFTSRSDRPLQMANADEATYKYVASLLGLSDLWVSDAVAGPSVRKQALPVKSNNAFIWATATDRFVVAYLADGGTTGAIPNGTPTGLALLSLYGPGELKGLLNQQYVDGSGGVHFGNVWDDGVFEGTVSDASNLLVGCAAITDVIS